MKYTDTDLMYITRDVQMAIAHDVFMIRNQFRMPEKLADDNWFTFELEGKTYKVTVEEVIE